MYQDIKCRIKKVAETRTEDGRTTGGYGFLISLEKEPTILRDIFFHKKNVVEITNGDIEWEDLHEGMIVTAGIVTIVPRGFEAFEIKVPVVKKVRKNHNW